MSIITASSIDLFNVFKKIIDFPQHTVSCKIILERDKPATIECSYYADIKTENIITEQFSLIKKEAS